MRFRRLRSARSLPGRGTAGARPTGHRRPPTSPRREGGQATIELALILPVILLLLLGIIKGGIAYNHYLNLTDAVRVGTRQLTLGRGLTDPCTPAITSTIKAAHGLGLTADRITITLTDPSTCGTVSGTGGYTGGNLQQGASAKLTATYPCDLVILGINFAPGCTLTASATETIE